MADWDKVVEEVDEIAVLLQRIDDRVDRILASQQRCTAIMDRILATTHETATPLALAEGYPAVPLLDRLHGIERRLTRLEETVHYPGKRGP